MYGDWSFPETSERRRRGGEGWHVANPFCGGGGKDIFLNKLGALETTCYAYF